LASAICFLQSCSLPFKPNTIHAPLLKKKGEINLNIYPTAAQAAIAMSDNIGLIGNVQYNGLPVKLSKPSELEQDIRISNLDAEMGVGYFLAKSSSTIYDIYGGLGVTNVCLKDRINKFKPDTYQSKGYKLFIQPSLGLIGKKVQLALTSRITALQYGDIVLTTFSKEKLQANNLKNNRIKMLVEPMITFRIGNKALKLQIQAGGTLVLAQSQLNKNQLTGNVGLSYILYGKSKEKVTFLKHNFNH
jgi:hypothetical protein